MNIPSSPILTPASWSGEELQHFPGWIHVLGAEERRELARAIESMRERRLLLSDVVPGVVTMPSVAASIAAWRTELQQGRGFVLVRGLPVEGYAPEDAARVYWLMGRCLGEPVPQNSAGHLLCDIRDAGADPEQDFHTDAADIIGLLCLKTARKGGVSRIVSSVRVFNQLLAESPELVPLLFEDWYFDLDGQQTAGMPPCFKAPVARWDGENLTSFFVGRSIRRAQAIEGVPALSPARRQLLEQYERTANDPRLFLDMELRPGDVQWLKSSVILHKDGDSPSQAGRG